MAEKPKQEALLPHEPSIKYLSSQWLLTSLFPQYPKSAIIINPQPSTATLRYFPPVLSSYIFFSIILIKSNYQQQKKGNTFSFQLATHIYTISLRATSKIEKFEKSGD